MRVECLKALSCFRASTTGRSACLSGGACLCTRCEKKTRGVSYGCVLCCVTANRHEGTTEVEEFGRSDADAGVVGFPSDLLGFHADKGRRLSDQDGAADRLIVKQGLRWDGRLVQFPSQAELDKTDIVVRPRRKTGNRAVSVEAFNFMAKEVRLLKRHVSIAFLRSSYCAHQRVLEEQMPPSERQLKRKLHTAEIYDKRRNTSMGTYSNHGNSSTSLVPGGYADVSNTAGAKGTDI